jgi:hypothetical protein
MNKEFRKESYPEPTVDRGRSEISEAKYTAGSGDDMLAHRPVEETEPVEMGNDMPAEDSMDITSVDARGISINPLNSGYLVKVGCQSVAVESTEKLIDMLNKYLTNPMEFERKWYSKSVRNRLDNI